MSHPDKRYRSEEISPCISLLCNCEWSHAFLRQCFLHILGYFWLMILTSVRSSSTWVVHHMVQSCASRRACAPMFYPSQQPCGTSSQTSHKETSSGNIRKQRQLWDFQRGSNCDGGRCASSGLYQRAQAKGEVKRAGGIFQDPHTSWWLRPDPACIHGDEEDKPCSAF